MGDVNEKQYQSFQQVIDETIELFDLLIDFESKKLDAIAKNDVAMLERRMNEEQAYLLKLRGLDQKRERVQKEMGYEGATFSAIVEEATGEIHGKLEKQRELLTAKTTELKAAVSSTKKYIDLHIHSLEMLLQNLEGEKRLYGSNGEKTEAEPPKGVRFRSTKI